MRFVRHGLLKSSLLGERALVPGLLMLVLVHALTIPRADAAEASMNPGGAGSPPRLAVVITVDQCRGDFLERFAPFFGAGGFRRLLEHGANYASCHYEHSSTKTAVGHATILSGAHPNVHGIVANDWFDADTWQLVNAVSDPAATILGATSHAGRSPRNLLAATVADQLKAQYGEAARVYGVANKDRSAILPPGRQADGAFWLGENDHFVSSVYYFPEARLPSWVEAFNAREPVAAYFGRTWDRLRDAADYERTQGPDDAVGEFAGLGLGRTFPRVIDGGKTAMAKEFSDAFDRSPFALEIIATFARELIEQEQLGVDAMPDLLCIGFSQPDTIGHDYGPDSHEVMDSYLRLDVLVAELLTLLDAKVGEGRYVVVVTADHGVAPMPERIRATRPDTRAERVDFRPLDRTITAALVHEFGPPPDGRPWVRRDNAGYRLSREALRAANVSLEQASDFVKATLRQQPFIAEVFTAAELATAPAEGHSVATLFRRSQFPPRTPDVVFAMPPYFIDRLNSGATHGSHHDYDTHVPLLWFGSGVPHTRVTERVGVTDLAPTLAALLGLRPPAQSSGRNLF